MSAPTTEELADVAALRADLSAVCAERDKLGALLDDWDPREGP